MQTAIREREVAQCIIWNKIVDLFCAGNVREAQCQEELLRRVEDMSDEDFERCDV